MVFDSKNFNYELEESWGESDIEMEWGLNVVPGICVDKDDNVYILSRGNPPIIVFNKDGQCLSTFGSGVFERAHGVFRTTEGDIYGVDDAGHAVYMFNRKHELVMTLGNKGQPSDSGCVNKDYKTIKRGAPPFNFPTHIIVASNSDLYVTDGYGNARVHRFKPDGNLFQSWGEPGTEKNHFNLPHGIAEGPNKLLYVADRQNQRIQIFTLEGDFVDMWEGFERPADICIRGEIIYVSECKRTSSYDGIPSRVSILDMDGKVLVRMESPGAYDPEKGHRTAHGIAVDSKGSIYIAEVGKNIPKNYFGVKKYRLYK
jgi:sugar lactone lactonase YvrE